ncbi:anti-sigma factor [Xanthobacter autotrophicus DSM 431]|uniref:anti-sigma factor family protein n=1 Tax=Xanthobacter nonsaccharivorans TaxID=3119912 RepID=UPI003729E028
MTSAPIGEDDLQAWTDGRLDDPRRAEVEAYLATRPEIAAQVEEDIRLRDDLRRQLADIAAQPVPAWLRIAHLRAASRARGLSRVRAAAAGFALLATGVAGGWLMGRGQMVLPERVPALEVAREAASAYRTFVVEVAHPVEVDTSREAHLLRWLSKRLGRSLAAPDLSAFGFRLMGGRLLPADAGAAAQLMYDDAGGRRLTVYVEASAGTETAFRFRQDREAGTFAWIDRGFGFAVTGPVGRDTLLPIAEAVYRTFEADAAGSDKRAL